MDKVVVSIGGSVFVPEKTDTDYIEALARMLRSLSSKYKLFIVVGGGRVSRFYIDLGRKMGAHESSLDQMGIEVTRLNAMLLIAALGEVSYQLPAKHADEAVKAAKGNAIVVMGGTHPGHTTDAVATMVAEKVKADRLINATNVDGIYTADPKKDKKAKKLGRMGYDDLIALTQLYKGFAGPNVVFDPLGATIIARARIPLYVVDGKDLKNLKAAIEGRKFQGTVVE